MDSTQNTDVDTMDTTIEITSGLRTLLRNFKKSQLEYVQCGRIDSVADGIARVYGLDGVQSGELLEFVPESGEVVLGMALNLEKAFVGAVLFGNDALLKEGDLSRRTKSIISVPTGLFLRGRVVDPLGQPLDDKGPLIATKQELIERKAPGIQLRARIDSPMATGIRAVDALVPIGNGQRELIIGDRQTGKTAIAVDGRRCAPFASVHGYIHDECDISPSQGLANYGLIAELSHDVSKVRMTNQIVFEKVGDQRSSNLQTRDFTSNGTFQCLSTPPEGVAPEVNAWQTARIHCECKENLEPKDTLPAPDFKGGETTRKEASAKQGTSDMPGTKKRAPGRSGVRVHAENGYLPVEGPQLGKVIIHAIKAFITVKNLKSDEFNLIDLAKAFATIEYYGIMGDSSDQYLGHLDLTSIISNPSFLLYCYGRIKKNSTPGIDNILPSGVTARGLLKLSKQLNNGTYRPRPTRRVYIDKPGTRNKRPLSVPCTTDKIVQYAVKMVLERLFEPLFSELSFGFRPNRSCHQALENIDKYWQNNIWYLEFDFRQAFDKINHRVLMSLLNRRFDDQKLMQVVWKLLKTGYVYPINLVDSQLDAEEGTPQGSILSPFMANVYFHELDKFMEQVMIPRYTVAKSQGRILSEQYLDATQRWTNNRWEPILKQVAEAIPTVPRRAVREGLRKVRVMEASQQNIRVHTTPDKFRLTYNRYADDFLIGYVGSKDTAKIIMQEILLFCEAILRMGINPEKTGIRHKKDGVIYLGYKLHLHSNSIPVGAGQPRKTRNSVMFSVPLGRLFKTYAKKGFFQRSMNKNTERYVGKRQDKWLFMSLYDIVMRYNSIVRGLINYYSGSERLSTLYDLIYNLRRSAALTIARQKNKRSAKWAFDHFGKTLKVSKQHKSKTKSTEFYFPSLAQKERSRWQTGDINSITRQTVVGYAAPTTLTLTEQASEHSCSVPGCTTQATQWHHITHRRKVGGARDLRRSVVLSTAHQIPVCSAHHVLIHSGKYDGPSLNNIKGYDPS